MLSVSVNGGICPVLIVFFLLLFSFMCTADIVADITIVQHSVLMLSDERYTTSS